MMRLLNNLCNDRIEHIVIINGSIQDVKPEKAIFLETAAMGKMVDN